jgi:predicted cobalt transporter CbtA
MGQPLSTAKPAVATSRPRDALRSGLLWGGAGLGALLLAVALGLWLHYGTTVFFETIAAGFASCF